MEGKILVIGGAGYIGSQVNKHLNRHGFETVVFDNLSTGFRRLACYGEFFEGDLKNIEDIEKCLRKYKIKAVLDFAAFASVGESVANPAKYYRNNVVNTINLLDSLRAFNINKLIFSSTCATYGEVPPRLLTEQQPQNPVNPYGRTKWIMEMAMRDYSAAYGLNFVALRYFNAAGADPEGEVGELHNPETHLIPLVLDAASGRREYISVFGNDYKTPDGTCIRDYIHTEDLAQAHRLALEYLISGGKSAAFNLGNGNGYSVLDIIKAAECVTGRKIPMKIAGRRAGDPDFLVGSSELIKNMLGWRPQYAELEKIISHAWAWHQKN